MPCRLKKFAIFASSGNRVIGTLPMARSGTRPVGQIGGCLDIEEEARDLDPWLEQHVPSLPNLFYCLKAERCEAS